MRLGLRDDWRADPSARVVEGDGAEGARVLVRLPYERVRHRARPVSDDRAPLQRAPD